MTGRLLAGLLVCWATSARAQDVETPHGDWMFGADANLAAASTTNGQGVMLGLVCSPNCVIYISSDMPCRADRDYDGSMESTAGNHPVRFTCQLVEGRFTLLASPTEAFIDAAAHAETLTFRVTLDAGATAFSFSLRGAYQAIYVALERAVAIEDASTI